MIWITGYVGSGKSTISKNFINCHEFDEIEDLMIKDGINLKRINSKSFKPLCKKYLQKTNVQIFNGIQATTYYKKGDKVYFVKTNLITSTIRSTKRDSIKNLIKNLKDNITLFFTLKVLYLKCYLNKDIIKNIDELNNIL